MVNINMTHVFKHPKFYRIPRDKDQVISSRNAATVAGRRAPDPGHKHQAQATSNKLVRLKPQATKTQAAGNKPQAPWRKAQASSHKRQAP